MKPYFFWTALLAALFSFTAHSEAQEIQTRPVIVIPVHDMIERGLVYVVRRAVAEAEANDAQAVILDIDTPGGMVFAAEEIMGILGGLDTRTISYVNPDAISAGAMIAMSTKEIYMAPGSRIGDAMPIMMTPFGGAQEMPEGVEEKSVSYVASLIRSAAQQNGHDARLAEAMVRREIEYEIDGEIICPEGQLLTLTNMEAEREVGKGKERRPLLSRGTVESFDALLETLGLADAPVQRIIITPEERIARMIEKFSVVFLLVGLLGIYLEFKTPGFGIPGLVGLISLGIWFWGHNIAGIAGAGELILFTVGVILLLLEIFVIPGFGIAGISGILLILISLAMAMVEHYPTDPFFEVPEFQWQAMLLKLSGTILATVAVGAILGRWLPNAPLFRRLVLEKATSRDDGYEASSDTHDLMGARGVAVTQLHPSGIGEFDGKRINVVTHGTFLDKGTPIVVAETHGNRIVVDAAQA